MWRLHNRNLSIHLLLFLLYVRIFSIQYSGRIMIRKSTLRTDDVHHDWRVSIWSFVIGRMVGRIGT